MDNPFNLNYDALDTKPVQLLSSAYNVVEGNMWVICNSDGAPVDDEGKEIVGTPDYDDTESDAETNMYNYSTEMQDELGLHVANLWDEEGNQPCMNYFYPLKELDASDAIKLEEAKLPLCIIEFESGDTGLALTGGGMDLTWEICQAFIVLGYYPPAHFAKLPRMGGRGTSDADKATIAICRHALLATCERATWALEYFDKDWQTA
jgi:hypothetical protein